jgi:uncharacterized protein YcgI (DUF1989 family)
VFLNTSVSKPGRFVTLGIDMVVVVVFFSATMAGSINETDVNMYL